MAKKHNNYDDTLVGEYIRQIENPDSVGWDAVNRIWVAPIGEEYDPNNRGMGVDVEYNEAAKALTEGREGKYLTELEERNLRNQHIEYSLGVVDRHKKKIPGLENMSPRKEAEAVGLIYRGDGLKLKDESHPLGRAYRSDNEDDFHQAVSDYYRSKGLNTRANNNNLFWKEKSRISYTPNRQQHIEQPDATRVTKPQPIFTPRGDVKKAMQDKVDYHNFMNDISIQNNPQPLYNPPMKFDDGGQLYHPKQWNELSMAEKAEMMKVAVRNGITTLPEIRQKYNEFAKGGYIPSDRIKDRITHYEGKAMTGAIDPLSGKYGKNNSFESEAKGFYNALPEDIREQVLDNPELADSLYSYSYNVGAGNFKKRVVPTLRRYYEGKASVADIERSMWATGDSKLRGLQRRRAEERAGVRSALMGDNSFSSTLPFNTSEEYPLFTPMNTLSSYSVPEVTLPVDEPLVDAAMEYAYTKEALERQERQDRLNAFNMLMGMSNPYPTSNSNSLMGTIGMLTGNGYAHGGNLFDGTSQQSQQMNTPKPNIFRRPDGSYFYQEGPEDKEINVTPMNTVFDNPSQWTYVDDEGRQYTPKQPFANNTGEITKGEDSNPLVKAANNYFRELAYRSTYDPSSIALQGKYTMPAIAASALLPVAGEAVAGTSIAGIPTMTWADTALTAGFGAHGLNKLFRGEINGPLDGAMTALEVAPLGRLAKPFINKAIQRSLEVEYPLGPYNIDAANKAFRDEEWANFLATRNGDNYYRMVNRASEAEKGYSPSENYFVSHTTPWEEFAGVRGTENADLIGKDLPEFHNRLYEFPTKTFGKRRSSSWEGVFGDTDVDVMGRNHLYYGDTSSGVRGPVRVISDKNAEYLGISPYKIGVAERPLTTNGFYDKNPIYEDIHMGNQTVINGSDLTKASRETTYNIFDKTPFGIQRTLFIGK